MADKHKQAESLIDRCEIVDRLAAVVEKETLTSLAGRSAILKCLKVIVADTRREAERLLNEDSDGFKCARRLSATQDALIQGITEFAVQHVYPVENPTTTQRMAVVAVGGYGRGTLAPASDIDLLFVLPYKQTAWGESLVEYILYILWDLGFKVGHATRSIDETLRRAKADMTTRTALLEPRMIWGDETLYGTLVDRFDREVVSGTAREFVAAKLTERDARVTRSGGSRYLVEPNIKEGKGGLRDLNALFWIIKYVYRVQSMSKSVKEGVLTRTELTRFRKAEAFLWSVRCHLHFLTGRAEEHLSFDLQREIAPRLGYMDRSGMLAVERFMKHYFLNAKIVGDLTRIICAELEEDQIKARPSLNRFMSSFTGFVRRGRGLAGTSDFVVDHGRLAFETDDLFEKDPVNFIRMFHHASRRDMALHPDLVSLARRSLKRMTAEVREDPEANRLFMEILCNNRNCDTILRRMNEVGVLGRFIPEFGKVVAMMQFNMYHHYTVDEHLIRSVRALASIDRGEAVDELPLSTEILPTIQDKSILYVALFLHDIAKGRPEDHSIAGARIARKLCPRFGMSAQQTETVAWLIEFHLSMSMIAQSRDLADRRTILDFSRVVQSLGRMKLLLILTVCDIRSVGPGVWNGWKGQVLRTLYHETEPYLTGGHSEVSREDRVHAARQELREQLTDWPQDEVEAYLGKHYPAYWIRVDADTKVRHAQFIRTVDTCTRQIAIDVKPYSFVAVTELTVYAPDHPRLLSIVAGACAAANANIVDAQIYTTSEGYALDSISLSRAFDDDIDEIRRAQRIGDVIRQVLLGAAKLPELVARRDVRDRPRSLKAFTLSPDVLVTNTLSDRFTVIEACGLDRPGLLFDLTRALSDFNLDISSAHVATFGERAVDVFYVTDLTGQKLISRSRQAAIIRRLTAAFDSEHPSDVAERRRVSKAAE